MTESTTIMSWAQIPSVFEVDLIRDGLVNGVVFSGWFVMDFCQVEVN